LPNVQTPTSEAFYRAFRQRFPQSADDYVHMRMQLLVEALVRSIEAVGGRAGKDAMDLVAIAAQLEGLSIELHGQKGIMRAADHQFQQPLVVGMMDRQGTPGVKFDVEGSGYGFRVVKTIAASAAEMPTSCKMQRY
jgi:branched-chain amino acid transport system substrate-binding protein